VEKTNAPSEKAGFVPKSNVQSPADAGSVFPSGYQQSPDDYNIMAPATGEPVRSTHNSPFNLCPRSISGHHKTSSLASALISRAVTQRCPARVSSRKPFYEPGSRP